MKNFERTSKMVGTEGKAAWEKGLKNFLTQNGLTVPEGYVWDEISYYEVQEISIVSDMGDNGGVCILVSGYSCGEPKEQLYDTDWTLVGEMSEATEFEWEYYVDQTATCGEEDGADSSITTASIPTPVAVNPAVTVNNAVENKEEEDKTMAKKINEMTIQELKDLAEVTRITKLQDEKYVNKDSMVAMAKANGMNVNRKTTRAQALEFIGKAGNARYAEIRAAEKAAAEKAASEQEAAKKEANKVTEAQKKTVTFMRKVLNYAADNEKKGHGYTISSEYLKYYIFEVQFGVKKFKAYAEKAAGTPEFAERMEAAGKVAKWAINKGYIKAVTYKVSFDFGGKHFERCCYGPEFNGSEETKAKMFPIDKCVFEGATNIKKSVTTYAVTDAAQAWR